MDPPRSAPQVLIAGAGPTGLVLALWLAEAGIAVRIVDRNDGPGRTSRALAVHARTLEFYRQLGIAEDIVGAGIVGEAITIRRGRKVVSRLALGRFGAGLSAFPFILFLPQDVHEELLVERLAAKGVRVERGTELLDFAEHGGGVRARLRRAQGETSIEVAFLCGCDGGHSRVRQALGIDFVGTTQPQVFYVADAHVADPVARMGLNIAIQDDGPALFMPVRNAGTVRFIGLMPQRVEGGGEPRYADVAGRIAEQSQLTVTAVNWFSSYRVHHRVAERFHSGRVFLAGDAAHIHSPAGGQGMNTGIGDAVNLAWKLASVLRGRAPPAILDSYESERRAFARELVRSTDRAFEVGVDRGWRGRLMRGLVFPHLLPLALRLPGARRLMFRTLSQCAIAYSESPLSLGRAGRVAAGDRLPWVGEGEDNHVPLRSKDWQLHAYGDAAASLGRLAEALGIELHRFGLPSAAAAAGLRREAVYLVRPDGHLGFVAPDRSEAALEALAAYAHAWGVGR